MLLDEERNLRPSMTIASSSGSCFVSCEDKICGPGYLGVPAMPQARTGTVRLDLCVHRELEFSRTKNYRFPWAGGIFLFPKDIFISLPE